MRWCKQILVFALSSSLILSSPLALLADTLAPASELDKIRTVVQLYSVINALPSADVPARRELLGRVRAALEELHNLPDLAIAYDPAREMIYLLHVNPDGEVLLYGGHAVRGARGKSMFRPSPSAHDYLYTFKSTPAAPAPPDPVRLAVGDVEDLDVFTSRGIIRGSTERVAATFTFEDLESRRDTMQIPDGNRLAVSRRLGISPENLEDWVQDYVLTRLGASLRTLQWDSLPLNLLQGPLRVKIVSGGIGAPVRREADGTLLLSLDLFDDAAGALLAPAGQSQYVDTLSALLRAALYREMLRESPLYRGWVAIALAGQSIEVLRKALDIYTAVEADRYLAREIQKNPEITAVLQHPSIPALGVDPSRLAMLTLPDARLPAASQVHWQQKTGALLPLPLIQAGWTRIEKKWEELRPAMLMLEEFSIAQNSLRHHMNNALAATMGRAELWLLEEAPSAKAYREVFDHVAKLLERFRKLRHLANPYVRTDESQDTYGIGSELNSLPPEGRDPWETELRVRISRIVLEPYDAILERLEDIVRRKLALEREGPIESEGAVLQARRKEIVKEVLEWTVALKEVIAGEVPKRKELLKGIEVGTASVDGAKRYVVRGRATDVELTSPAIGYTRPGIFTWRFWRGFFLRAGALASSSTGLLAQADGVSGTQDVSGTFRIFQTILYNTFSDPMTYVVFFVGAFVALSFKKWEPAIQGWVASLKRRFRKPPGPWEMPPPGPQEALRLALYLEQDDDLMFLAKHVSRVRRGSVAIAHGVRPIGPGDEGLFTRDSLEALSLAAVSHNIWAIAEAAKRLVLLPREHTPEEVRERQLYVDNSEKILGRPELGLKFTIMERALVRHYHAPWKILTDHDLDLSADDRERLLYLGMILFAVNVLDGRMETEKPYPREPLSPEQWEDFVRTKITGVLREGTKKHVESVPPSGASVSVIKKTSEQILVDMVPMLLQLARERHMDVDKELARLGTMQARIVYLVELRSQVDHFWPYGVEELRDRLGLGMSQNVELLTLLEELSGQDGPLLRIHGDAFVFRQNVSSLAQAGKLTPYISGEGREWMSALERDILLRKGRASWVYAPTADGSAVERAIGDKKELAKRRVAGEVVLIAMPSGVAGVFAALAAIRPLLASEDIAVVMRLKDGEAVEDYQHRDLYKRQLADNKIVPVEGTSLYCLKTHEDALIQAGHLVRAYTAPDTSILLTREARDRYLAEGVGHYALLGSEKVFVHPEGVQYLPLRQAMRRYRVEALKGIYKKKKTSGTAHPIIEAAFQLARDLYEDRESKSGGFLLDEALSLAATVAFPVDTRVSASLVAAAMLMLVDTEKITPAQRDTLPGEVWDWIERVRILDDVVYAPPPKEKDRLRNPYVINYINLLSSLAEDTPESLLLYLAHSFHVLLWKREQEGTEFEDHYRLIVDVNTALAERLGLPRFSETMKNVSFQKAHKEQDDAIRAQMEASFEVTYEELGLYTALLQEQVQGELDALGERLERPSGWATAHFDVKDPSSIHAKLSIDGLQVKDMHKLRDLVRGRVVFENEQDRLELRRLPTFQFLSPGTDFIRTKGTRATKIRGRMHPEEITADEVLDGVDPDPMPPIQEEAIGRWITKQGLRPGEGTRERTRIQGVLQRLAESAYPRRRRLVTEVQFQTREEHRYERIGLGLHVFYRLSEAGHPLDPTRIVFDRTQDLKKRLKDINAETADSVYVRFGYTKDGVYVEFPHRLPKVATDSGGDTRPTVADVLARRDPELFKSYVLHPQKLALERRIEKGGKIQKVLQQVQSFGERVSPHDRLIMTEGRPSKKLAGEAAKLRAALRDGALLATKQVAYGLLPATNIQSGIARALVLEGTTSHQREGVYAEQWRGLLERLQAESHGTVSWDEETVERLLQSRYLRQGVLRSQTLRECCWALHTGHLNLDQLVDAVLVQRGAQLMKQAEVHLTRKRTHKLFQDIQRYSPVLNVTDVTRLHRLVGANLLPIRDLLGYFERPGFDALKHMLVDVDGENVPIDLGNQDVVDALLPYAAQLLNKDISDITAQEAAREIAIAVGKGAVRIPVLGMVLIAALKQRRAPAISPATVAAPSPGAADRSTQAGPISPVNPVQPSVEVAA